MNKLLMEFYIILTIFVLFSLKDVAFADQDKSSFSEQRSSINKPRIINGTEADWIGSRHQVSIRLKEREWFFGGGFICGGSLIADDVVLTAAHCIYNYGNEVLRTEDEFSVVVGNLNLFQKNHTLVFNVTKISMLPTVVIQNYTDDIALMFLSGKVPENFTYAYPVELNENRDIADGTKCEVSGWGKMETQEFPSNLMVVDVEIINRTVCSKSYNLTGGMICAGYIEGLRDACQGDSGGPLSCDNKLVGVVSYGNDCALPGYPGVYADVAYYIDWIYKELGRSGVEKIMPTSLIWILSIACTIFKFKLN